jgi:hypothetical protein
MWWIKRDNVDERETRELTREMKVGRRELCQELNEYLK